jgi:glycine betaine/proline transport system ATP-binding protein
MSDKIASFAGKIVGAGKNFLVTDSKDKPVGEVTPTAVIDLLADRDGPRA